MNPIKFSHRYDKLPGCGNQKVRLLEVFKVNLDDLSARFIDYDTMRGGERSWNLPKGELLVLLFEPTCCPDCGLFTTVRRWTEQKEKYYRGQRGEFLELIIEEE